MNIFALDYDPVKAALYHNDKHCVKMVTEYAQLLSIAHHLNGSGCNEMCKITHVMHPCSVWTRLTRANYEWLNELYHETAKQYQARYNRIHEGFSKYEKYLRKPPAKLKGPITTFALAMPDQYKHPDPVEAYRAFYIGEKAHFAKWRSPSTIPYWFQEK